MSLKRKRPLSCRETAAFCEQLAMILNAGISAYEGIAILMDNAPDEETKQILTNIYEPLANGQSLHYAIESSCAFPRYMQDMVLIGEQTGHLAEVFVSLTNYYEREESIRSGIRNAVSYPLLMIGMMFVILIVLITRVIPVFEQIYAELGSSLTGFSRSMMGFSSFLNRFLPAILLLLFLFFISAFLLVKSSLGKILFQEKGLPMSIAASRFANCMALALSSGMDMEQGLSLAGDLVDNPYMEERISRCKESIAAGRSFSESILSAGIFEKLYASMVAIGVYTGSMDHIMQKIGMEYEKEIDRRIEHLITVLEPTLVIILSVVIGLILLSFLLPLAGIMSNIG